jgi:hypothetical protein
VIAELAFRPNAAMAPHTNPNLTYFVVIEGGGFVIVGDERARVAAGEAVVWPPNVVRAAWTELTPMRALVIEFAPEQAATLRLGEGPGRPAVSAGAKTPPDLGPTDGGLVTTPSQPPTDRESPGREPW